MFKNIQNLQGLSGFVKKNVDVRMFRNYPLEIKRLRNEEF